jgi:hypothetical protein
MCGSREFDVFASWYMMNGGDLYELAKILGHANIQDDRALRQTWKHHIVRTGNTAVEMWNLMKSQNRDLGVGTA